MLFVMPALVAGIHVFSSGRKKDVGGRNKSGHDGRGKRLNIRATDPVARAGNFVNFGAGEGIRTLDPNLGKVVLYP